MEDMCYERLRAEASVNLNLNKIAAATVTAGLGCTNRDVGS